MRFHSRKLIKPENLNAQNTLFGEALLRWTDEEAGIYAMTKLDTKNAVTKYISEIDFTNTTKKVDVIESVSGFKKIGLNSIRFSSEVRNVFPKQTIIKINNIVFVKVDKNGNREPHGKNLKNIKLIK